MAAREYRVIVAGAGLAGLAMSEHLKRRGINYTVYEKAGEIGGTWRDNTFPGLFVDVLSRQYEFPFAPNLDWSRKFAPGPEIQAYLLRVAKERALREAIRFNEEITEARFTDGVWKVTTSLGRTDEADALICATGFLSVPVYPEIEGRERFAGPSFHSARWDHSVPLQGTRWGIIGGGASGVQITEALGGMGCPVTQFIRRAQWVHLRENPPATEADRARLREPGGYDRVQQELWDGYSEADSWRLRPGSSRERMERDFNGFLATVKDPGLRAKLTPKYHLGCTRIPKSDAYYAVVQQPNVAIETNPIDCIVAEGVKLKNGQVIPLDALVYATGFDSHAYMRPMRVFGHQGLDINNLWKDGVFSYKGFALPGFPNLFLPYGPFSPVNNVSVPLGLEQQISYMLRMLEIARERRSAAMPSAMATRKFVDSIRAALPGTVWVGCRNWYSDATGTPILWPKPQDDHTAMLAEVALEDLEFVPAQPGE